MDDRLDCGLCLGVSTVLAPLLAAPAQVRGPDGARLFALCLASKVAASPASTDIPAGNHDWAKPHTSTLLRWAVIENPIPDSARPITEHATDTHGVTLVNFGPFDLLRLAGSLKFGHATASLLVGKLSAPLLLVSLAVGIVVSLVQTVLSLQDQTISIVPRLVLCTLVLLLTGNWMLHTLVDYTTDLFNSIPDLVK